MIIEEIPAENMNEAATGINYFLKDKKFPKNAWQSLKDIWQGMNDELPSWFFGLLFCLFYLSVLDCIINYAKHEEKRL